MFYTLFTYFSCKIRGLICLFASFVRVFSNSFPGTCNALGVTPGMGYEGDQHVKSPCPHAMYSPVGDTYFYKIIIHIMGKTQAKRESKTFQMENTSCAQGLEIP